ncbi:MAG: hypothetical protein ACOCVF_01235 [bacterium]
MDNIEFNKYNTGLDNYYQFSFKLIKEIEKWSEKYQITLQIWGQDNINFYLYKDGVELFDSGGHSNVNMAYIKILHYIYRINRVPYKDRIC